MNKRATAMGFSVLAGLLFIVSVPKLFNSLLQLTSVKDSYQAGYATGYLVMNVLFLAFGVFCARKASKGWKQLREQEKEEYEKEYEQELNERKET